MSDVVVRAENLGKRYRIGRRQRYRTLRDTISETAAAPLRWLRRRKPAERENAPDHIWALRDLSFGVRRGEAVGVIGRNGAGKSTLLKVLSQVTEPTTGEVEIRGRVGSLLEVGAGFHPELSGRENLFLSGAVLGMKRAEIIRKFDEIVAFAEVSNFIDTPVKRYSSGMYTRLAFAVAAHLEPDILIVDEVLAVGDAAFQKKCLGKMGEVAKTDRTVLFVSHNMHAVNSLCNRSIVLEAGRVVFNGSAAAGVARYLDGAKAAGTGLENAHRIGSGEWRFTEVASVKTMYDPEEPKEFTFRADPVRADASAVYLSGQLVNEQGVTLSQFDSRLLGLWIPGPRPTQGRLRVAGLWLKPGRYTVDLFICTPMGIVDRVERAVEFDVSPVLPYPHAATPDSTASALVLGDFDWQLDAVAPRVP